MSTVRVYQAEELRPIHDRILVTEMEFGEQKTAGGIIMPVSYTHLPSPRDRG